MVSVHTSVSFLSYCAFIFAVTSRQIRAAWPCDQSSLPSLDQVCPIALMMRPLHKTLVSGQHWWQWCHGYAKVEPTRHITICWLEPRFYIAVDVPSPGEKLAFVTLAIAQERFWHDAGAAAAWRRKILFDGHDPGWSWYLIKTMAVHEESAKVP